MTVIISVQVKGVLLSEAVNIASIKGSHPSLYKLRSGTTANLPLPFLC